MEDASNTADVVAEDASDPSEDVAADVVEDVRADGEQAVDASDAAEEHDTDAGDATDDNADTGEDVETIPQCVAACQSAADCAQDNVLYDEDNYACDAGACVHLGCQSSQECTDGLGSSYTCTATSDDPDATAFCIANCQSAADCSQGSSGAFGTANYACNQGLCEYLGCQSSQECDDSFGEGYACTTHPSFYAGRSYCLVACTSVTDCADAMTGEAFDADNYTCHDGGCVYVGCNEHSECANTPGAATVCR